jgi:hypothetical protein
MFASGRVRVFLAALIVGVVFQMPCAASGGSGDAKGDAKFTLRILNWKTGEVYVSVPANPGDRMFFGWIHSLEKIPWNEYYHIDDGGRLILDAITFPAFGAGIPENKGKKCYVKDGLIHMEEINQVFEELTWLNSETATRDIRLGGKLIASGTSLPHHARVRLVVGTPELCP